MNVTVIVIAVLLLLIVDYMILKNTLRLRLGRIESELESEKETRKRRNDYIDTRLHELEKIK